MSIYLISVYLSIYHLSVCPFDLSIFFIYLSIYLSIYLFIYLFIDFCICLICHFAGGDRADLSQVHRERFAKLRLGEVVAHGGAAFLFLCFYVPLVYGVAVC